MCIRDRPGGHACTLPGDAPAGCPQAHGTKVQHPPERRYRGRALATRGAAGAFSWTQPWSALDQFFCTCQRVLPSVTQLPKRHTHLSEISSPDRSSHPFPSGSVSISMTSCAVTLARARVGWLKPLQPVSYTHL